MSHNKLEVGSEIYFVHSFSQTETSILQAIIVEGVVVEVETVKNITNTIYETGNIIVQCINIPKTPKIKISKYKIFSSREEAQEYAKDVVSSILPILNNEDNLYRGIR